MSKSKLFMAAGYITAVLESDDETTLKASIRQHLQEAQSKLESALDLVKSPTTTAPKASNAPNAPIPTSDEVTEDAVYELLKDESKPGPTLIAKHFKIKKAEATKLFKAVKPRLVPAEKPKADNVMTIVGGLPDGPNLLVKSPFHYLAGLDKDSREQYLMGLNPKDMIDADKMKEAAGDGADKTLIKQIDSLKDSTRPTASDKDVVAPDKYQKKILGWVSAIPDGGDLFNHMSAAGLTKKVLRDLRDIAELVDNGEL